MSNLESPEQVGSVIPEPNSLDSMEGIPSKEEKNKDDLLQMFNLLSDYPTSSDRVSIYQVEHFLKNVDDKVKTDPEIIENATNKLLDFLKGSDHVYSWDTDIPEILLKIFNIPITQDIKNVAKKRLKDNICNYCILDKAFRFCEIFEINTEEQKDVFRDSIVTLFNNGNYWLAMRLLNVRVEKKEMLYDFDKEEISVLRRLCVREKILSIKKHPSFKISDLTDDIKTMSQDEGVDIDKFLNEEEKVQLKEAVLVQIKSVNITDDNQGKVVSIDRLGHIAGLLNYNLINREFIMGQEFRDALKQNLLTLLKQKNMYGGIKRIDEFLKFYKVGYSSDDIAQELPEELKIIYQEIKNNKIVSSFNSGWSGMF